MRSIFNVMISPVWHHRELPVRNTAGQGQCAQN